MDFFVPMLFVCWIGGQCVEAHHQSEVFDTQDKCHQFLDTWAPEVIENLRKRLDLQQSRSVYLPKHQSGCVTNYPWNI